MRINLSHKYKSIASLTTEELPDFAVLIGRNGAGKTQLLEALEKGLAEMSGISSEEIKLYNLSTFYPPNTNQADRNTIHFGLVTADTYLLSQSGRPAPIQTAAVIFDTAISDIEHHSDTQALEDFEHNLREEIRHLADFTVFADRNSDSPYKKTLYEQVLEPLNPGNTRQNFTMISGQRLTSFYGNQAALLSTAMKLSSKFPHELTRTDIIRASHIEGDTLSNQVSAVFAAYKLDQSVWAYERFDNETERVNRVELINEYQTENPPPWETLRRILSDMRDAAGDDGLFNFKFSDPSHDELSVSSFGQYSFTAVMTNRTSGAQYDLDSLSSGEKILMALCLLSFNQYLGRPRPRLLLLDELDTVLHPSMVTALVTALKDLFVSKGTKVLMTTHSPITVAALDESEIFRVVRTGSRVEVSGTTMSEAINELSEGLATIDMGLKIAAYDEAKVTILTEGHNAKHLKKWVEVIGLSEDVHVFEELAEHRNDSELLTYGRLLGRMNTNTHFVIVWDCDAAKKAETLRQELPDAIRITPFAFKRRQENSIARNGIENNFDEKFLEAFSITKSRSDDGTVLGREFHKDRKTDFADHVQQHGTVEYFEYFQDLHDIISDILESS